MAARRLLTIPPGLTTRAIRLTVRHTGRTVAASIFRSGSLPPDDQHDFVQTVEQIRQYQWFPRFKCFAKPENDKDWEWWGFWASRFFGNKNEPNEFVVVASKGLVEGVMIVGPSKKANLHSNNVRLLYIARMATAPWNRKKFVCPSTGNSPKALAGVGTALIKEAICLSEQYGYAGRLGLRAMGNSKTFYAKVGMQYLGRNVKDNETPGHPWYEFSNSGAREFLGKNGACQAPF